MKLITLSVLALFSLVSAACAADRAALESAMDHALDEKAPGVILLVEGPEVRFFKARGLADRKTKEPIRRDHLIRAASVTKTYVAALAVMAAQEGVIDLDAAIDAYLPDDVLAQIPPAPYPTMRQLLNHTAGLPEYYGTRSYLSWDRHTPVTTERVLSAVAGRKATHAPGEAFSYANTHYHLAALILEGAYDASLATLMQGRLLEPLGLASTYYDAHRPPGDDIHGYGSLRREWQDTHEWRESTGPDAGVKASAADLAAWMRALFAPGGALAEIGAVMVDAPVKEDARTLQGMGAEILVSRTGIRFIGHTGDNFGYLTAVFYSPEADTVVVLHMNRWDRDLFQDVLGRVLRAVVADAPG